MTHEVWRSITGYDGMYRVSNRGRILSVRSNKIMSPTVSSGTEFYPQIRLSKNGSRPSFKIHRIVMNEFVGPRPDGMEVAHLDGSRDNNRLDNLKYVTRKENSDHQIEHGTRASGVDHPRAAFGSSDIIDIKNRYFFTQDRVCDIAKDYGVHRSTIRRAANGITYTTVFDETGGSDG